MSGFAAVILAAGRSSRMGDQHKLLATVAGQPMIAHAVTAALASTARPVIVVTGYRHDEIAAACNVWPVTIMYNADYAAGMAGSLALGIAALPPTIDGAVILLGDMPRISATLIDRMIAAATPAGTGGLTVPSHDGVRGHPVVIGRDWFAQLAQLQGDTGARRLIESNAARVLDVNAETSAIFFDVDTPEALASLLQAD